MTLRIRLVWLVIIMLASTWLGARQLDADGFWSDELITLFDAGVAFDTGTGVNARITLPEIWTRIAQYDPWQTPGYFYLFYFWAPFVGISEFASRALSLLIGLLAIAAMFRLAYSVSRSNLVATASALGLAGCAWFIYYLHEARVYTLYILLTVMFVWIYWEFLQRPARVRPNWQYAALIAVGAALLYTQYYALVLYGMVGLLHLFLLFRQRSRHMQLVFRALIIGALLFAPWLSSLFVSLASARETPRVAHDLTSILHLLSDTAASASNNQVFLLGVILLIALNSKMARRLLLVTAGLVIVTLVATVIMNFREVRYFLGALPFLVIAFGYGVARLRQAGIALLVIAVVWFGAALSVSGDPAYQEKVQFSEWIQPYRETAAALVGQESPPLKLIVHFGGKAQHIAAPFYLKGWDYTVIEPSQIETQAEYVRQVENAVADQPALWVAYSPRFHTANWGLFQYLLAEKGLTICETLTDTPLLKVYRFGRCP